MQYFIVRYPEARDVYLDGQVTGKTNCVIEIEPGRHTVHLGGVLDYQPAQQVVDIQATSAVNPYTVEFAPKIEKGAYVEVSVKQGDVLTEFSCDVLVVKYAQALYGVDGAVVTRLAAGGFDIRNQLPEKDRAFLTSSHGTIKPPLVLFVGVDQLSDFRYRQIREFSTKALSVLARDAPETKSILLTLHGTGYGLDEAEAMASEVAGFVDAVNDGEYPQNLENIIIAEHSQGRVNRLKPVISKLLPDSCIPIPGRPASIKFETASKERLKTAGYESERRPHIFVAMPFSDDMDDIFHYGIQAPVNDAGFLCERADLAAFTGDVMSWVKERITKAALVVADLSGANPNVYLEVGYAWGCNRPTVLLVRNTSELVFDVKGQRCIVYRKIRDLEEALKKELHILKDERPHD